MSYAFKAIEFKIPNSDVAKQFNDSIRFLNSLSASKIDLPFSYLFFLNSMGRYIADVFLFVYDQKIFLISYESILNNLISHFNYMDIRKQICCDFVDLFSFFSLSDFSSNKDVFSFKDPFGIGFFNISYSFIDYSNQSSLFLSDRIKKEIAIFDDFEFERSVVLEYGSISKFISFDKGCYLGQEFMQRVSSQGVVRKTLKCLGKNDLDKFDIVKILSSNDQICLAKIKI